MIEPYRGHAISINDSGKFAAEVGGEVFSRSSLSALRKAIDEHQSPIIAFEVDFPHGIEQQEVIGFNGDRPLVKGKRRVWHQLYQLTDEQQAQLGAIRNEYEKNLESLEEKWDAVLKTAIRVDKTKYKQLLKGVTDNAK